jgi:NAD-dependent deacetylase
MGVKTCVCGGKLVSSVVNFGDPLPQKELSNAFRYAEDCDLFIVVGSSLVVSPANEMPKMALKAGARLIIINQGETSFDGHCHLRFEEKIGEVLPPAVTRLKELMESSKSN